MYNIDFTWNEHSQDQYPRSPLLPFPNNTPSKGTRSPNFQLHRLVLPALKLYKNRIIQCVLYCVWLLSLNILLMNTTYVVAYSCSLFIPVSGKNSTLWIHHNLFTHPTVVGHLSGFQFLAIKNNTAMNILMPVWMSLCMHFHWELLRNGTAGSWAVHTSVDTANFPISCTNLCSHEQCMSVPFTLYPCQL